MNISEETSIAKTETSFCPSDEISEEILDRYGNSICILDTTYKTTKYAIPLFFLAVKTDVDYQVSIILFVLESK